MRWTKVMANAAKLSFLMALLLPVSCHKDTQIYQKDPIITETSIGVNATNATFVWEVEFPGKISSMLELSTNEDMSGATRYGSEESTEEKHFEVTVSNLSENTKYYYRYITWNPRNNGKSAVKEITTLMCYLPTVTTATVINITHENAVGGGDVTNDGGSEITERGVCWSTEHNPTTDDAHGYDHEHVGIGNYTVNISGLSDNTAYYVRAYAINSKGTSYGNEMSFTTMTNIILTTNEVEHITGSTALAGGSITNDGGAEVIERGVCWSTQRSPIIDDAHDYDHNHVGLGNFSIEISSLSVSTTYYLRAYAINSKGTSYGNEVSFTTEAVLTEVSTAEVTNISSTSATGGGSITFDGGAEVTERGVCWSTQHDPTIDDAHDFDYAQTGTGDYTVEMTGLEHYTTYYVRAYATNSIGTAYGWEVNFKTLADLPTVSTNVVYNTTSSTATCKGTVIDDGGLSVIERGVCWSTNSNPTLNDAYMAANTAGIGEFTCGLTGLTSGATYYVRAYATNSKGTGYGDQVSVTIDGYLPGLFSVSDDQQVRFAPGNLRFHCYNPQEWGFAPYQYTYVGASNASISSAYNGYIDLFGWGTSNRAHGAVCYQPWSTSTTNSDYFAYGSPNYNLEDQTGKADWGFNKINDVRGRTLNQSEWYYLLFTRTTVSGLRFAKATVGAIKGLILLPDIWSESTHVFNRANDASASFSSNVMSASEFNALAEFGVVFLSAGGRRVGKSVANVNEMGSYWSSTHVGSSSAQSVFFSDASVTLYSIARSNGCAVRLVRDVN